MGLNSNFGIEVSHRDSCSTTLIIQGSSDFFNDELIQDNLRCLLRNKYVFNCINSYGRGGYIQLDILQYLLIHFIHLGLVLLS